MKLNSIQHSSYFSSKAKKAQLYLSDVRVKNRQFPKLATESISEIKDIKSGILGGTICAGSRKLSDFFSKFTYMQKKELLKKGQSTNNEGYPHSFLKDDANIPLSTSFVHDCSALYLFNKKTNTHALYHAAPDCEKQELDMIVQSLMPEGYTHATIIPGANDFVEFHPHNMNNMFDILKQHNSESIISVRHYASYYPEIVGYKGNVYQISNENVANKIKRAPSTPKELYLLSDRGQASFKILDLQGYNTFDDVHYDCNSLNDVKWIKKTFAERNYPQKVLELLNIYVEKRMELINKVSKMSLDEIIKAKKTCRIEDYHIFSNQYDKLKLKALETFNNLLLTITK